MPHSEIIHMMEVMDEIREKIGGRIFTAGRKDEFFRVAVVNDLTVIGKRRNGAREQYRGSY